MVVVDKTKLEALFSDIVQWRRYLHTYPELSFQEVHTPVFIAEKLESLGLEVKRNVGGRGVVATLRGEKPGPTIALRADFDALPIEEENEVSYQSQNPGVMHACGHDGHAAALLGVATVLAEKKQDINGAVVFLFQHAEEKPPGGAQEMIKDGCLDGVDAVFGAHVATDIPLGQVNVTSGPIMAAVDAFTIHVQGKGGHGARPHNTKDAVMAGTQLVTELQQIVSRRVDPMDTAVVTVGVFQAGTAFNVIADSAHIEGTVRTFNETTREQIEEEIRAIVKGVEHSTHVSCDVDYLNGYPPLVNPEYETKVLGEVAAGTLGEDAVISAPAALGGEDFAFYLQERPGQFFHVGARTEDENTQFPHHHPRFNFDEEALLNIGKLFMGLVERYLSK
ncbi:M20 metallopeptidase family protein [Natribacillus halophilus]|uniref:Amidohydrolase n=1 Tax=Natribacillus halophilus TaxID=549003 RepID=A0A1G8KBW6_9BACI|nr:amidohydrolase [Natribacillus halophilus]SDI40935.1 amidohydrolase [Natribacillus halophilus]